MYNTCKNNINLAAQLKAESANWVGYNSKLVDEVAIKFQEASLQADNEISEKRKTFFSFLVALAITIGIGYFTIFISNDSWQSKKEKELIKEITLQVEEKYKPILVKDFYEKDGLLYIRKE